MLPIVVYLTYLGALGLLLYLSGFFSGSETSLFFLDEEVLSKLRPEEDRRDKAVVTLLKDPEGLLITVLFGNLLVNTTATVIAVNLLMATVEERALEYAILLMTFVLLIFGEITPKTYAVNNSVSFARRYAPALLVFRSMTKPVQRFLKWLSLRWVERAAKHIQFIEGRLTKKEMADLLEDLGRRVEREREREKEVGGKRAGGSPEDVNVEELEKGEKDALDRKDVEMIRGVFHFSRISVKDLMRPREEVVALPEDVSREEFLLEARIRGKNRIPLYKETLDNVVGVVHVADFFPEGAKQGPKPRELVRPVHYVTPNMKAIDVLAFFRENMIHFSLVRNDEGRVIGLITLEDLLEELVGDINDDFEPSLEELTFSGFSKIISPRMSVKEFNLLFKTSFQGRGTIGKVVEDAFLGKVRGRFTLGGVRFEVIGWDEGKPTRFLVTPQPRARGRIRKKRKKVRKKRGTRPRRNRFKSTSRKGGEEI